MTVKKTTRSARSRAEVQDEFADVSKSVRSKEALPASERAIQETRNASIRESVKGVTLETAVQKLTQTSLDVQKTFASLSEQIASKVTELNQLQEAVTLERAELEKLHGADIIKSDLTALIADHDAKVVALQAEIEQKKVDWAQEKAAHDKAEAERVSELSKTRTREAQDFAYTTAQARKKDQDQWEQTVTARERDAALKKESLEKGWTVREETLKGQEKNLADLQIQVAAFPETLKKETDKQVAIATSSVKKEITSQFALEKKDLETGSALAKQEIASLKATNATLLDQMGKLQVELAKAQEQVKSIAEKALDSASGSRTLAEMRELTVRERDNNTGRKQ